MVAGWVAAGSGTAADRKTIAAPAAVRRTASDKQPAALVAAKYAAAAVVAPLAVDTAAVVGAVLLLGTPVGAARDTGLTGAALFGTAPDGVIVVAAAVYAAVHTGGAVFDAEAGEEKPAAVFAAVVVPSSVAVERALLPEPVDIWKL